MTEREQAYRIANDWLDGKMNALVQMVPGDPDCDAVILARQYIRLEESLRFMLKAVLHYFGPAGANKITSATLSEFKND